MIVAVAAVVTVALLVAATLDEFRYGGSLSLFQSQPDDGDVLELPIPEGWCQHDVLMTLAEIASL